MEGKTKQNIIQFKFNAATSAHSIAADLHKTHPYRFAYVAVNHRLSLKTSVQMTSEKEKGKMEGRSGTVELRSFCRETN